MTYAVLETTYVTYNGLGAGVANYNALLPPPLAASAAYAAGSFLFPTSTGAFSVTGLGFKPELVVMFGGNQPTEDTLLTGLTRPGLFLSLNARGAGAAINSFCLSIATNTNSGSPAVGYTRFTGPIRMQGVTGSAAIDYRASAITFDADGFTLTVSHAAPGARPVHFWATSRKVASTLGLDLGGTFPGTFEIKSFLALSSPQSGSLTEGNTDGDSWLGFGSSHYPGNATIVNQRVSRVCHTGLWLGGLGGRQGYTEQKGTSGTSADWVVINIGSGAAGTLTDGYTTVVPDVLHGTNAVIGAVGGSGITEQQLVAWLDAEGTGGAVTSPATVGASSSIGTPGWFDSFGLVMFTTVNGPNKTGAGFDNQLRYGIGILHPAYQGCIAVGDDGSFYQSRNKFAATCTAAGAQAAKGTITGPTFEAKTVLGGSVVGGYHAFGGPIIHKRLLPQIYRRVFASVN